MGLWTQCEHGLPCSALSVRPDEHEMSHFGHHSSESHLYLRPTPAEILTSPRRCEPCKTHDGASRTTTSGARFSRWRSRHSRCSRMPLQCEGASRRTSTAASGHASRARQQLHDNVSHQVTLVTSPLCPPRHRRNDIPCTVHDTEFTAWGKSPLIF